MKHGLLKRQARSIESMPLHENDRTGRRMHDAKTHVVSNPEEGRDGAGDILRLQSRLNEKQGASIVPIRLFALFYGHFRVSSIRKIEKLNARSE